jgi:hypothetical protein
LLPASVIVSFVPPVMVLLLPMASMSEVVPAVMVLLLPLTVRVSVEATVAVTVPPFRMADEPMPDTTTMPPAPIFATLRLPIETSVQLPISPFAMSAVPSINMVYLPALPSTVPSLPSSIRRSLPEPAWSVEAPTSMSMAAACVPAEMRAPMAACTNGGPAIW